MAQRGIGRGRGKISITRTGPINPMTNNERQSSPTNNESKPSLYDQYSASWRDAKVCDSSDHERRFTRQGDSPIGSSFLWGDANSSLGHASAEAGFSEGLVSPGGLRTVIGCVRV
jgi:hypothetical protein